MAQYLFVPFSINWSVLKKRLLFQIQIWRAGPLILESFAYAHKQFCHAIANFTEATIKRVFENIENRNQFVILR